MAFPNAPVPHWLNVCFDYVLSRSCQGTLSGFLLDEKHAFQQRANGKGTVNRQDGVLIITHSDFDSKLDRSSQGHY